MKRRDDSKVSLVDFLRSIRFTNKTQGRTGKTAGGSFARLDQRARVASPFNAEDSQLVRSAN